MSIPEVDNLFSLLDSEMNQQVIGDVYLFEGMPNLVKLESKAVIVSEFLLSLESVRNFILEKFGNEYYIALRSDLPNLCKIKIENLDSSFKQIEESLMKPLSYSQPSKNNNLLELPWSFIFFKNKLNNEFDGKHVLLFKTHHRICDGCSFVELSKIFEDESSEIKYPKDIFAKVDVNSKNKKINAFSPKGSFLKLNSFSLFRRLSTLNKILFRRSTFQLLKGKSSKQRKLNFLELPREQVLALKDKVRVSPNNVLMSMVAHALKDFNNLKTSNDRVTAIVPVNIRGARIKNLIGNYLSVMLVDLPLNINSPHKILNKVSENSSKVKNLAFAESVFLGLKLIARLPSFLTRKILGSAIKKGSFISTNIPANDKILTVAEERITGRFVIPALIESQGLAFSFVSYSNKYFVTIVSDPAIVPDAQAIKIKLEESFKKFVDTVLVS